jgi:hypothetical protein
MTSTIQQTIDELRDALTKYIEATYHIGHPGMVRQRRRLLEAPGGIFQFPYLESTPRYVWGERYENMSGIPRAAREALTLLAAKTLGKPLLYNPPYSRHSGGARKQEEPYGYDRHRLWKNGSISFTNTG